MNTHTPVDNFKLSPWYFAVSWARRILQDKIVQHEKNGFNPVYDIHQLEQLDDLEQFLKMSWDEWMQSITPEQTVKRLGE
jgi:hypothetical protein